jgi:hypothetical protein
MAEDKDNLMLALGREPGQKESKKFESEGLIGDDDESAVQQFKSEQAVEKQKSEFLQSLKEIGGEKLSQTQIAESLSSLEKTIAQSIDLSVKASVAAIAPDINKDILQVGELLKSMEDKDKEKALDIIEDLQKKLGIDLRNFSSTLSNSIDKLSSIMEKRKAEREKREVELETEQEILKEKGIYTKIVDNQITKERELKILTNNETKKEFKRIREEEIRIIEDKKRLDKEQKQLQKGETIQSKDNKRLIDLRNEIIKREEKLNKDKTSLSFNERKPTGIRGGLQATGEFLKGERGPELLRGPMMTFTQTLMAPIEAFKQLSSTIKGVGQVFGGLLKGARLLTMGFFGLLVPMLPYILAAAGLAAVIFGLFKAFKFVAKIFGFGGEENKDLKGAEEGQPSSDMAGGEFDDTKGNLVTKQVEGTTGQASEISSEMPSEEKIRPTTDRPTGDMFTMKRKAPTAISPLEEFTDLSKDYAMSKEASTKPPITFNNVQPMNNITSSSNETIMPITPMNDDPTFMNLNTRSI